MKVILVDDEPLVLIGMQSMLNWAQQDAQIVGTARNGADAWQLIQSQTPDLVICDIMMPVMNGLDLLEKCRKELGSLPLFIILTGYEEYDYVKRCLKLGVTEYLVKVEFTPEDLSAALQRAKERLAQEHRLRKPETEAGSSLAQYRNRLLLRLCTGSVEDPEDFRTRCSFYGLHFDAGQYIAAYAQMELRQLPPEQRVTLSSCITSMASDILPRYLAGSLVTGLDMDHFVALIPMPEEGWDYDDLEQILRQTGTILNQYFGSQIRWATGSSVANIMDIRRSLRVAASLLAQSEEQEVTVYRNDGGQMPSHRAQLIARIQEYIRSNLDKRLTLNDVAAVFNFSPNYLSQLLSASGEQGFVDFVTATRVAAAKELMHSTDLKIYEISEKLGFDSAFYFSKVFKRIEGISPREYMQMLGH